MADEAPKAPFTDEQNESLRSLVGGIVNSAIRSRDQMSDKKREQDKADILKAIDDKLSAFKPAPSEDEGGKGGKGGRNKEADLEVANLRKQLDEIKAKAEASEQRANAERAKNRAVALTSKVQTGLKGLGINEMSDIAIAWLEKEGRLSYAVEQGVSDDEDQVVFRADDGSWVSLDVGLQGWAKTERAKHFLPPSGAKGGSGSRPTLNQDRKGPPTEGEVRNNLGEALKNALA